MCSAEVFQGQLDLLLLIVAEHGHVHPVMFLDWSQGLPLPACSIFGRRHGAQSLILAKAAGGVPSHLFSLPACFGTVGAALPAQPR